MQPRDLKDFPIKTAAGSTGAASAPVMHPVDLICAAAIAYEETDDAQTAIATIQKIRESVEIDVLDVAASPAIKRLAFNKHVKAVCFLREYFQASPEAMIYGF